MKIIGQEMFRQVYASKEFVWISDSLQNVEM